MLKTLPTENMGRKKKKVISSTESTNHVVISDGSTVASEAFPKSTQTEGLTEKALRKWIIPVPRKFEPVELTLLNRVVWVKYRQIYWWPAILYNNYSEIAQQQKIWDQLDIGKRMRLSCLTMVFTNHPSNRTRIARLLGRPSLVELVEVRKNGDRCEFYWQLPTQLKRTCDSEYFRQHPDLYYDWHRAFDQMEELLRDCLGKRIALNPTASNSSTSKTWLQRAREAELRKWQQEHPCLASCCACGMVQG